MKDFIIRKIIYFYMGSDIMPYSPTLVWKIKLQGKRRDGCKKTDQVFIMHVRCPSKQVVKS